MKSVLSVALTLLFAVPYFALQRMVVFPVRRFDLTSLDRAVAFEPQWVWVYQSVYLLIAIVPWLATTRADLMRYTRGFAVLALVSFTCFLIFPVAAPRPAILPATGMFAWLVSYDGITNTIPSLHVGLAVYTFLVGTNIFHAATARARRPLLAVGAVWVSAIAYASLATKQHYVVDVPAGLGVAMLAYWWAWRDRGEPSRLRSKVLGPSIPGPV